MVFELEDLWPDWIPEIGDPGECIHCEPKPGPTADCKTIKEKIVIRKKCVIKAMTKQDPGVSVHVINENLHNIERLRENWENIHFNPPYKWAYLSWKGRVPVYYHELKQKYNRWTNSNYQIESLKDFPPLTPVNLVNGKEFEESLFSVALSSSIVSIDGIKIDCNESVKEKEENLKEPQGKQNKGDGFLKAKRKRYSLTYAQVLLLSLKQVKKKGAIVMGNYQISSTNIEKGKETEYINTSSCQKMVKYPMSEEKLPKLEAEKNSLKRMLAEIFDGP